jgi:hypothetical protein
MGLASGFANWMRGSFEFGRHATDMLTRTMEPEKARKTGGAIDTLAGVVITAYAGLQTLGTIAAVSTAAIGLLTLSAPVLPALATVGIGLVFGSLSAMMTATGFGFLSAAKNKLHIPGPVGAVKGVGHGIGWTAHQVARPFKWTGRKLSHIFKRAHDGDTGPINGPSPGLGGPRPGRHSL